MAIPDHRQYSYHRLQTVFVCLFFCWCFFFFFVVVFCFVLFCIFFFFFFFFLLLHKSKFFKKPNYKSRKEDFCQKCIFVPALSFIFFQSLFLLNMKFLKIVLFQGSAGLAPPKPNNMYFSSVLPISLKLRVCLTRWMVVVVKRKVLLSEGSLHVSHFSRGWGLGLGALPRFILFYFIIFFFFFKYLECGRSNLTHFYLTFLA